MTEIMGTTCSMIYLGRHVMSRNKELLWYLSQKRDVPCSNDILYIYIYICIYINFGENGWWISYLVDGSPPARWGSLDFIRVAFSFFFFFFSSGSLRSQLRAPDLSVGTAGPQQALPDLNRELQISVGTAIGSVRFRVLSENGSDQQIRSCMTHGMLRVSFGRIRLRCGDVVLRSRRFCFVTLVRVSWANEDTLGTLMLETA